MNRLSSFVVRSIREAVDLRRDDLPDSELVERFAHANDAAAFATLVRRHGSMVLGVCRRILQHEQDAEDVFQAVFLVLSRKAGALHSKEAVGPWLFGVARRLALRVRHEQRERQRRECRAVGRANGDAPDDLTLREVQSVLDEELARLPQRQRGPIVLCYLEGLTRDEAARQLGCPLGTLKSRLEKAKAVLQKRLALRGIGLPALLSTFLLPRGIASGREPALFSDTVDVAAAFARRAAVGPVAARAALLAEAALKPQILNKFAFAAAAIIGLAVCGVGVGLSAWKSADAPLQVATQAPPDRGIDLEPEAPRIVAVVQKEPEKPAGRPGERKEAEPLPAIINGVAKSVDAERGTLVVAHREGEDTFSIADGARIEIDGAPGQLGRLPTGANVALSKFVGPKTAQIVQAAGRSYFGNLVKAVDIQKNSITIRDREGESIFDVAANAMIWVDGKAAELAAVPPGAFVNIDLASDQRTARSIGADGPSLGGCGGSEVEAVDIQKRTITFARKSAPDVAGKSFLIAKDALITINGNRAGTLLDVPAGCYVNLLLRVDLRTVGGLDARGPSNLCAPGGSVVKAVDAEKGTITFDDAEKSEIAGKTFSLAKDAIVVVDDKAGQLSAIAPGTFVDMRLWLDRRTIGSLHTCGQPVPGIGVVRGVDAKNHTITVGDETYPVAKLANIQIDGKTVSLGGVPVGVSVTLKLNVDRKTVGAIFQVNP